MLNSDNDIYDDSSTDGELTFQDKYVNVNKKQNNTVEDFKTLIKQYRNNVSKGLIEIKNDVIGHNSIINDVASLIEMHFLLLNFKHEINNLSLLFLGPQSVGKKKLSSLIYKLIPIRNYENLYIDLNIFIIYEEFKSFFNTKIYPKIKESNGNIILIIDNVDRTNVQIKSFLLSFHKNSFYWHEDGNMLDLSRMVIIWIYNLNVNVLVNALPDDESEISTLNDLSNLVKHNIIYELLGDDIIESFDKIIMFNELNTIYFNHIIKNYLDKIIKTFSTKYNFKITYTFLFFISVTQSAYANNHSINATKTYIGETVYNLISTLLIKSYVTRSTESIFKSITLDYSLEESKNVCYFTEFHKTL